MLYPLGAMYGYAFGCKEGTSSYWEHNEWFRCLTYAVVTAAVIAASIFVGGELIAIYGISISWTAAGAIIGALYGFAYGGTNHFKGGWNYENAFKWMMYGAIIGAAAGYSAENCWTYITKNSGMSGGIWASAIGDGEGNAVVQTASQCISPDWYAATIFQGTAYGGYIGYGLGCAVDVYAIYSMGSGTRDLLRGHFSFIPGVDVNLENGESSMQPYDILLIPLLFIGVTM